MTYFVLISILLRTVHKNFTSQRLHSYISDTKIAKFFLQIFFILKLEGCWTVHLPHERMWNANLMQRGNFIDKFLARHVRVRTPIIRNI